ncbi:hypothetical protein LCGC14_2903810, partial [marine sediment metagenome]
MGVIYGDSAEPAKIHKLFRKRIGDQYEIRQLGFIHCDLEKLPLYHKDAYICVADFELPTLIEGGFKYDRKKSKCQMCANTSYVRVADFTNDV